MGLAYILEFKLLILYTFASSAAVPDCGTTNFFVDGYLQKTFNVGPNGKCIYSFEWRANAGSFITATADGLDSKTAVSLENDFAGGKKIIFDGSNKGEYSVNQFFAPGTVKLSINSGKHGNIAVSMTIAVSNVTKDAVVEYSQVITGSQPIVISDNLQYGTTYVYSSTSNIVLAVVPECLGNVNEQSYFDSVFVYDGQGPTAKFIGSLREIYSPHPHDSRILSTSMTLFPTSQSKQQGKIIINNQQNIGAFEQTNMFYYFSHDCRSNQSEAEIEHRKGQGSTSVVSYGTVDGTADYIIITGIEFKHDAKLVQVYGGLPTNKMAGNYLKQITKSANVFPLSFPGTAITLVLDQGSAIVHYTSALTPNAG